VHEDRQSTCSKHSLTNAVYTDAGVLVRHTVYTAVVCTVWPLLGTRQNGQILLYLFQKRLPFCNMLSVAVRCCVTLSICSHLQCCLLEFS